MDFFLQNYLRYLQQSCIIQLQYGFFSFKIIQNRFILDKSRFLGFWDKNNIIKMHTVMYVNLFTSITASLKFQLNDKRGKRCRIRSAV